MDGRSESPGETRARHLFAVLGLPGCEPRATRHDPDGRFVARVDFLFRQFLTIVEFDGMLKDTGAHDLRKETVREDRLRSLGYEVVRPVWSDLDDPARVPRLIVAAFQRAMARRRSPGATSLVPR